MGTRERDDDGERRARKDRKRSRDERDHSKKKRKHKHKHKHKRERRAHSSGSDSDGDDAPAVDYPRALAVVRELLSAFPEIAGDLLGLLQMVDDGQAAVIGGLENRRVRAKLKELFPLLGLTKLRHPNGAYAKRGASDESLLQVFERMLADDGSAEVDAKTAASGPSPSSGQADAGQVESEAPPKRIVRSAPIGPAMPPPSANIQRADGIDEADEDDDVIGPALPGMKGFRVADERVEAEMARQAKQLENEAWARARGEKQPSESKGAAPLAREEWMTVMPETSFLKDSLGQAPKRPASGKPAAFRSKEPAAVDKSWFASPEERDRAKRANLDMQLLGYVREENAPAAGPVADSAAVGSRQSGVNESIVPSANPEADSSMRQQMEQLKQSRGPTLLEQHQRKVAEEAKAKGTAGKGKSAAGWDRERDLTVRRGMSNDDADRIINASKQMNSKFTAPTITRQFL